MANDNGRESEFDPVLIPLSLIEALAAGLFQALDNWQEERGIESMDTARCFVAMAAAVDAVMEHLSSETTGVTLQ
jgi:hypothetical protein